MDTEIQRPELEVIDKQPIDATKEYDPEAVAKHLGQQGYCVVRVGDPIEVKSCRFKVASFTKKVLMLQTSENIAKFKIKVGEKYAINECNFTVQSFGKMFLRLACATGFENINGKILDDAKVKEDRKKEKELKKVSKA
jgi:hypothetical protein